MNVYAFIKQILIKREEIRYQKLLSKRHCTYGQWLCHIQKQENDKEQSKEKKKWQEQSNSYVCFLASEGKWAENALKRIETAFLENPEYLIVYGDEDIWQSEKEEPESPWFKPDFSPDLLDSFFYFGSVVAMREVFWKTLSNSFPQEGIQEISSQNNVTIFIVDNLPVYQEWVRNCVKMAGAYQKGSRKIGHLSSILFHCAGEKEYSKNDCSIFSKETSNAFLKKGKPNQKDISDFCSEFKHFMVSIVIPSKDHSQILKTCLQGIAKAADHLVYEIILVDNGSSTQEQYKIKQILEQQKKAGQEITWIYQPMEFHFSKMCNLGAKKAKGDFLLFLNDDVELIKEGSLFEMVRSAQKPYTGAVGIKLYYPHSITIQHAGISNLPIGPVHKLQFLEDNKDYYFHSNQGSKNVLAVTGACLMIWKEKFWEAGGFCEKLPIAFNDVELCFHLHELGYYNVCRNDIFAYHYESLSRGEDEAEEKVKRLRKEREQLYQLHPVLEGGEDPYYSAYLNRQGLDTRIVPGFETANNIPQQILRMKRKDNLKQYRKDNCLLLRVENVQKNVLTGYSVVLGDNNACYEKELVFCSEEWNKKQIIYTCKVEGQYRPDLIENMKDQKNVGLCGFCLDFKRVSLPKGEYRIGMTAKSRVGSLKLVNWSNSFICV